MPESAAMDFFSDRFAAGVRLATALQRYAGTDSVVLGLARGGVEVGAAVAETLGLPLRALVVRKVGAPGNPELAVGAVSETGRRWIDHRLKRPTGATDRYVQGAVEDALAAAKRQAEMYGTDDLTDAVRGRVALLVDDGVATGATALVAIRTVRELGASRVVLATPVASIQATRALRRYADEVVVLVTPEPFRAVGLHYGNFQQVQDATVLHLLQEARRRTPMETSIEGRNVQIEAGSTVLPGTLSVPADASGIVVFAHGSGSGRYSPRNALVARILNDGSLGTLLADLLTQEEAADRRNVFDIGLLASRVLACVGYVRHLAPTSALPCGLFGASTGGAAALVAAARQPSSVGAVVSRGGRPDLAADALEDVRCPTLLLVGSRDESVVALNRHAFDRLHSVRALTLIPGATHLFEEPGTLEEVARESLQWFRTYLSA